MKTLSLTFLLLFTACSPIISQSVSTDLKWSERMALSIIERNPDPVYMDFRDEPKWEYTFGLVLKSIERVHKATGDDKYLDYIDAYYDFMIEEDGTIKKYDVTRFNIDRVAPGRALFHLYDETGKEKYKDALEQLRYHLKYQPRNHLDGFWHKLRYPWQMWLDGLYMGSPFYAEWGQRYDEYENFDDVALQAKLMFEYMRDPETGLLYHGWDQSKTQKWADPETGLSPNFWGRAMGWYGMAIVDILDYFPEDHPQRDDLIIILEKFAEAVVDFQDEESGVWYQVIDQGDREGNYLEASASIMFTYAIKKGANKGYLDEKYHEVAEEAWQGILDEFIEVEDNGLVNIHHVCAVAGLGGDPYRDASYEYYVNERIQVNDTKATGPFIKLSLEMDR
ncbi:glycoside hydrolase family 88/105 protein [Gracilimonas mengyeensis]|uniref:Unsaturated rhamnogalacturonyl hydrolase n=1 Tax=Gracilimonas mengyeensis TaxID=1302730 RepID=A0A521FFB4_9BACT|nr:glycoside hydrolase family 88 protein [Gracilimonas mengyeensis]SMO94240.1 unsaturated rhamnogalacturonyl hydrolase [Gracilimonas mengyeensis]